MNCKYPLDWRNRLGHGALQIFSEQQVWDRPYRDKGYIVGELRKILRLTAGVGEELIRCGAEISRVEDTMNRIALHYGVTGRQIFIISNGVFVNLEKGEEAKNVSFQHIPQISVDMSRLCELNSLSRDIEQKDLPLEQALARFEQIRDGGKKNIWLYVAASGVGAGAFCYLFGGDGKDCFGAFLMGLLLWLFFMTVERYALPKVVLYTLGGILVTSGCILLLRIGVVDHLDKAIMGAIIPMIPGVAFVNGIRDIADSDYISGSIRLLDALLIFICIAAGVCIAFRILSVGGV